jgi:uracil-DNA glycosylase
MSLEQKLGTWYKVLYEVLNTNQMKTLGLYLNQRRVASRVYPSSENVFKAFELTPLNDVKCVIIGQDPYPTYSAILDSPVADGLAFSTSNDDKTPVSLVKIQKAIEDDCYDGFKLDYQNDLTYLAEQGVLLLNKSLTVEHGAPLSHNEEWDFFIEFVIKKITNQLRPIAFITFGKGPKELLERCNVDTTYHQIINVEHPAYASRQGRELEHKNCFSLTNLFLEKHYGNKINW